MSQLDHLLRYAIDGIHAHLSGFLGDSWQVAACGGRYRRRLKGQLLAYAPKGTPVCPDCIAAVRRAVAYRLTVLEEAERPVESS